jgi:hypothetical protein|tara:strand:+ start:203 stop:868 length:666 start_codon:yes stop_codon:yes gene_type:complete
MGRYRSSPTCSKCWQQGHTKRGCPAYRAKAEKWLAENPEAEGYEKPYWVREVETYKNMGKNRKCSWCSEQGHNKRSCPARKEATLKNISKNKEWRAQVLESMKKMGLGNGALIRDKRRSQRVYIISNMNWDKLNITASSEEAAPSADYSKYDYKGGTQYAEMTMGRIDRDEKTSHYMPMLKDEQGRDLLYYGGSNYEIVSPVEPNPPSGWIDDEGWAKKLF